VEQALSPANTQAFLWQAKALAQQRVRHFEVSFSEAKL
jgi:hypothetical protein